MTIFSYKGLTRNPEIENTPVWILPNIWRLGWARGYHLWHKYLQQNVNVTAFTVSELLFWSVCYYHVTYAFQCESTVYSCLNVKELLAWNGHDIWRLSESNRIQAHNHLVCKRTLNHLGKLAKWLSCVVRTYRTMLWTVYHYVTYALWSCLALISERPQLMNPKWTVNTEARLHPT